jgi:DNA-binding protein H-NS
MAAKGEQQAKEAKQPTREEIRQQIEKHRLAAEELERQERDLIRGEATDYFNRLRDELPKFVPHLSVSQRQKLADILSLHEGNAQPRETKARGIKKGETLPPRFQFDSGETWTGRGRMSLGFGEKAKAWEAKHGNKDYPAYPNPNATNAPARIDALDAQDGKRAKK